MKKWILAALFAASLGIGAGETALADTRMGVAYNTYVYCTHTPTPVIRPTGTLRRYCTNWAYRTAVLRHPGGSCTRYLLWGEAWDHTFGLQFFETFRQNLGWDPDC